MAKKVTANKVSGKAIAAKSGRTAVAKHSRTSVKRAGDIRTTRTSSGDRTAIDRPAPAKAEGGTKRVNVRSFKELGGQLESSAEGREAAARAEQELTKQLVEYSLGELRQHIGVTQALLAERLGIKQPSVSALERQDDMMLSTLRSVVQALGGELHILVDFPAEADADAVSLKVGSSRARALIERGRGTERSTEQALIDTIAGEHSPR